MTDGQPKVEAEGILERSSIRDDPPIQILERHLAGSHKGDAT